MSLTDILSKNVKAGLCMPGEIIQTADCYRCGFSGCKHDIMDWEFNRQQEEQRREFKPSFGSVDPNLEGNMYIRHSTPNTVVINETLYNDEDVKLTNSYIHHDKGPGRVDPLNTKLNPYCDEVLIEKKDHFNLSNFIKPKK